MLLVTAIIPLFAFPQTVHNVDVGYVVFGIPTWEIMRQQNESLKKAYYALSNAASIAIDYNGSTGQSSTLVNLKSNLQDLGIDTDWMPNQDDFVKLGGGKHRAYNHQGFGDRYYQDAAKAKRWKLGRDEILIPTVQKTLNVDITAAKLISLQIYYSHTFGDLVEGQLSSIRQMVDLSSPSKLANTMIDDLEDIITKNKDIDKISVKKIRNEQQRLRKFSKEYAGIDMSTDTEKMRKSVAKARKEFLNIDKTALGPKYVLEEQEKLIPPDTLKQQKRQARIATVKAYGSASLLGGISAGVGYMIAALASGDFEWSELGNSVGFGAVVGLGMQFVQAEMEKGTYALAERIASNAGKKALAKAGSKAAEKSTEAIAKNVTNFMPVLDVAIDTMIDVARYTYYWKSGLVTGQQALRNGGISIGINVATGIGVQALSTFVTGLVATSSIAGPIGWAIAIGGIGIYAGANVAIEKITHHFDINDIRQALDDEATIRKWTKESIAQASI